MSLVYANSEEKFLKAVITYPHTEDYDGMRISKLYYDEAFTQPVYGEEARDLFIKGLLVIMDPEGLAMEYLPVYGEYEEGLYRILAFAGQGLPMNFTAIPKPGSTSDENSEENSGDLV